MSLKEKMVQLALPFLTLASPFQCMFPKHQLYLVMTRSVFLFLGTENVPYAGHGMD